MQVALDRNLVFDMKYQKTCLACANVYACCDTIRNTPSENDRKNEFLMLAPMKNLTSYVLNTVSSRGHECWRGLKFGENLSARTVLGR